MSDVILNPALCEPYAEDSQSKVCYAIVDLRIQLRAGVSSECTFKVVGPIHSAADNTQDTTFTQSSIVNNKKFDEIISAFGYGRQFYIKQALGSTTTETETLFIGYVKNTGTSVLGDAKSVSSTVSVSMATAPYFYDNEWMLMPYAFSRQSGDAWSDVPRSRAAVGVLLNAMPTASGDFAVISGNNNSVNILKYLVVLIDKVDENTEAASPWSKLSGFVDIESAPVIPFNIASGDLIKALNQEIGTSLDQQSGIAVLIQALGNYFLTLVPRFTENGIQYVAIPDCGILKKDKYCVLNASDIFSYTEYQAQRRPGKPTAVVVRYTVGQATPMILKLTMGYDSTGNPVKRVQTREDLFTEATRGRYSPAASGATSAPATGSAQIAVTSPGVPSITAPVIAQASSQPSSTPVLNSGITYATLGRHNAIPLPVWAMRLSDADRPKLAKAVASSVIGAGGDLSGRIGIECTISRYAELKNLIGEVIKIQVQDTEVASSAINRFGRLMGVDYSISDMGDSLRAELVVTLDCALSETDFNMFSIDKDDLLCVTTD